DRILGAGARVTRRRCATRHHARPGSAARNNRRGAIAHTRRGGQAVIRRAALLVLLLALAAPARAAVTQGDLGHVAARPPPRAALPLELAFRSETGQPPPLA